MPLPGEHGVPARLPHDIGPYRPLRLERDDSAAGSLHHQAATSDHFRAAHMANGIAASGAREETAARRERVKVGRFDRPSVYGTHVRAQSICDDEEDVWLRQRLPRICVSWQRDEKNE